MEEPGKRISAQKFALLFFLVIALFAVTPCHAFDVTLAWDASPDAEYYVVYWGTSPQNYASNTLDDGTGPVTDTTCTIHNLDPDTTYYFVVRAFATIGGQECQSRNSREVSFLSRSTPLIDGEHQYNAEWGITAGDANFTGLKFLFDSSQGLPTLGATDSTPGLDLPGIQGLGSPLNPEPTSISFNPPVKILIPCLDPNITSIYYYSDAATGWVLANAADTPNIIERLAQGWMVAWHDNSNQLCARENNQTTTPPTVAIKVQHFSAVQAGIPAASASSGSSSGGGGGGCLIGTAASGSDLRIVPFVLLGGLVSLLLAAIVGYRLRRMRRRSKESGADCQ